jgi:hypothetical protein
MEMRGIIQQLVWKDCREGDAVVVHRVVTSFIGNEVVVRYGWIEEV